ncbi:hypothetical protein [Gymnodinialimonas hymeniacidonis]|uniref:hypothetical protein n=1 Tax=Gymnodinialimonas hymeniacidonis TaxID=3126508 RepID=UPI0034C5F527
MSLPRLSAIAFAIVTTLTAPAAADCIDWGLDLEVCSTPDISVAYNEIGFPFAEIRTETRLTQVFWTVSGPRIESETDLENSFWTVWSLVGDRLEGRGHLDFNRDYMSEINGQTVFRNPFVLRPEDNPNHFYIHLSVFDAFGVPAAIEIIEPVRSSDTQTTNALLAQAMQMIQPQGTGQ